MTLCYSFSVLRDKISNHEAFHHKYNTIFIMHKYKMNPLTSLWDIITLRGVLIITSLAANILIKIITVYSATYTPVAMHHM